LILAEGRRSWLACDLARSGSNICNRDHPDTTRSSDFTVAARQIV
jgi:hypothetical protein